MTVSREGASEVRTTESPCLAVIHRTNAKSKTQCTRRVKQWKNSAISTTV